MSTFIIRTFVRGVVGMSASGADVAAVSHAAGYDSETGLLQINKAVPWDDPIKKGKPVLYIGDFQPDHVKALDYVFDIKELPEAIAAYRELVATGCFMINQENLPSDTDPKDAIFVKGIKSGGKGVDIEISDLVNQTHISVLILCLFAQSIRRSVEFSDALDICANGVQPSDYEDDDYNDDFDPESGTTGLSIPSLSFGFGRRL